MKKIIYTEDWDKKIIDDKSTIFIVLLKQGSFDYGYVEAYDTDDKLMLNAFKNLIAQFEDVGCEEDTKICLISLPNTIKNRQLCDKALFNGNNQAVSSLDALADLYNDINCEELKCWYSNNLQESKRRKKTKKKKIGGYITYTTGDPDLNIKHFNKSMGTLGLTNNADQWSNIVGDVLPDGPVASGGDAGESAGEASGGEGGIGESLNEALTPTEKMEAVENGTRKENWKACGLPKLEDYWWVCEQNLFDKAIKQVETELNRRFDIKTPFTAIKFTEADLNISILQQSKNAVWNRIETLILPWTPVIFENADSWKEYVKKVINVFLGLMVFKNPEVNKAIDTLIERNITDKKDMGQAIQTAIKDPFILNKLSIVLTNTGTDVKEELNMLQEAKRYVKRYYVRPQNIFCSNKDDILKALLRVGDKNCSIYSLKNLEDHDDVHKLTNKDIIYYYDDGILYDKNHVKVMDYDLFVQHEEKRKKFSDIDTAPEETVNKEYDDRLTKDDLKDKEVIKDFKAINEDYDGEQESTEENCEVENPFELDFERINAYGESLDNPTFTCCICGDEYEGYGNNPWPIKKEGRCCDMCNANKVIPARLEMLNNKKGDKSND